MGMRSTLARVMDWAGIFLLMYVAAFIWLFSRMRDIAWASGIALPLSMLLAITAFMFIRRMPWARSAQDDAQTRENHLFRLIIATHEDALREVAGSIFMKHGLDIQRVENGVAYADERRVAGVTQGRARPEDILHFYKGIRGADFALYCSLMEPESGTEAVAARLSAPRVTIYGPNDIMPCLKGEAPTPREKQERNRSERARGKWNAFKKHAIRREQSRRYMLYALILSVAYILTQWPWYPVPAIVCAALGAASAHKAWVVKSPFEDEG